MTPSRLRLQPAAQQVLIEIYDYTALRHGDAQAKKYLQGLRQHLENIAVMPRFHGRSISPGSPVLKAHYGDTKRPHAIYFRETPDGIEIGRIGHPGEEFTRGLAEYERQAELQSELDQQLSGDRETDDG